MVYHGPGIGEGVQALDFKAKSWNDEGYGVKVPGGGACAVSINTGTLGQGDTLSVAAGDVFHGGSTISVTATNLQVGAADPDQPRKDTVWVASDGTVTVEKGTPTSPRPETDARFDTFNPSPPLPATTPAVLLAEVWVPAGASSITAPDLRDRRVDAATTRSEVATDTLTVGTNSALIAVAASGQTPLSSGSATVNTGISATDATFYLALGIDDPNADAKVAGRLFWDDSAGTYKVEIVEDGTSVGNPTVNYDVLRVR